VKWNFIEDISSKPSEIVGRRIQSVGNGSAIVSAGAGAAATAAPRGRFSASHSR